MTTGSPKRTPRSTNIATRKMKLVVTTPSSVQAGKRVRWADGPVSPGATGNVRTPQARGSGTLPPGPGNQEQSSVEQQVRPLAVSLPDNTKSTRASLRALLAQLQHPRNDMIHGDLIAVRKMLGSDDPRISSATLDTMLGFVDSDSAFEELDLLRNILQPENQLGSQVLRRLYDPVSAPALTQRRSQNAFIAVGSEMSRMLRAMNEHQSGYEILFTLLCESLESEPADEALLRKVLAVSDKRETQDFQLLLHAMSQPASGMPAEPSALAVEAGRLLKLLQSLDQA